MATTFDGHKNFASTTVVTAPTPAASGTTLVVADGTFGGASPTAPFNISIWPTNSTPTPTNAEIARVTVISTNTLTITRIQESSSARAITVGDNVALTITKKALTDIETAVNTLENIGLDNSICDGRLTLTSGTPVTTADVTGAVTIYYTPYSGNRIALYSGTAWNIRTFTEITIALGTLTSALPYDVFAYDNAGVVTCEILAWISTTTRATALVLQDGVLSKSGATTRRYLGTFYTTSTTTTEDSATKRYVWNYYNYVARPMQRTETSTWNYTTATIRQANGSTSNQLEVVVGVAERAIDIRLLVFFSNTSAGVQVQVGIGEDSTSTFSSASLGGFAAAQVASGSSWVEAISHLVKIPAVGRHVYSWNEYSAATGTTAWSAQAINGNVSGLFGIIGA